MVFNLMVLMLVIVAGSLTGSAFHFVRKLLSTTGTDASDDKFSGALDKLLMRDAAEQQEMQFLPTDPYGRLN